MPEENLKSKQNVANSTSPKQQGKDAPELRAEGAPFPRRKAGGVKWRY